MNTSSTNTENFSSTLASNKLDYIDEETLSRAILTFCLEGADAVMYTLLLGSQHANNVLEILHSMVSKFVSQQSASLVEQMQLPIADNPETEENNKVETNKNCKSRNNKDLTNSMLHCVENHESLSKIETYFNKGLKAWGYHNSDAPQSLNALHNSLAKWCIRLTHLPTWDHDALCNWFTNGRKQWIIAPHSKYWPKQLQDLAFHSHFSPPLCLWGVGNPQALTQCHNPLAIVGSRSCTDYGRELAYKFAYDCASKGHSVISGGAYGIDAAAHWGALQAYNSARENQPVGKTIAVFAGGLNNMGPQGNAQLFDEIISSGGACISELCPDTTPVGHRFLLRNRIIAALSSKVIVAQARLQSGALNTATWATDLNRELYAVPGDITHPNNAGCNKLIHDSQAIILCSNQDINTLFPQSHHYVAYAQAKPINQSAEYKNCNNMQKRILDAISTCNYKRELANIDKIYEIIKDSYAKDKTDNMPTIADVSGSIALLELEGIVSYKKENLVIIQQKVA